MILRVLGPTSSTGLGTPLGLGCPNCEFFETCGGTTEFDCYANCCGKPQSCTLACPRSHRFVETMQDAGGLGMKRKYAIGQKCEELPVYVPHIQNGSSRAHSLAADYVALTTFDVSAPDAERFQGPEQLREHFGISKHSKILLISVAKDRRLEHHWRYSKARKLSEHLATLGISHVTAPNFSFALNEPRPEHLVNRSRSLLEAERMAAAGLSVIPHLNAFNQRDWACWRDFLRDHSHLTMIAQEFQTGLSTVKRATWHISQMLNIQQVLGRGIRLVAVGARRHLPLMVELSGVTIVDANPFLKTHVRQKLVNGKWQRNATPAGAALDDLMHHNITAYTEHVEARFRYLKNLGPIPHRAEIAAEVDQPSAPSHSEQQLSFWPTLRAIA